MAGSTPSPFLSSTPDGKTKYKKWRYYRLSSNPSFILFTRIDVTENFFAEYDTVTGMPTKEKSIVEIKKIIQKGKHDKYYLMWIDFDEFKDYNQLFGRERGDELLKFFAVLLSSLSIPDSVIGHIESDNFLYFMPVESFKEEDFRGLYQVLCAYNEDFSFSVSNGVSLLSGNSGDIHKTLGEAHQANQKIKYIRGVSFRFYDEKKDASLFTSQSIVPYVKQALKDHEFFIHYQPIVDSRSAKTAFGEALVRWNSKKLGLIYPDYFIPVLEKNGFITDLDYYVREEVLSFMAGLINSGFTPFPVSVNISRLEIIDPLFPEKLKAQLDSHAVPVHLIRLELTESMVMENPEVISKNISGLKKLGFYLEMDDFGSAYSSLSVLKDLPFDLIKLDMKFFQEDKASVKSQAILQAVSALGQKAGLDIIAEGVEEEQQMEMLKKIGIHYIQGYYYSKPLPKEEFMNSAFRAKKEN